MIVTIVPNFDEVAQNSRARDFFQVRRQQFNKKRAVVDTSKRFGYTKAQVGRASYWW